MVIIGGRPAVFLGSGEQEWTAVIRSQAPTGLRNPRLAFRVASFTRQGHPFDLDNLASVVLKIVAAPLVGSVWATLESGDEGVSISEEMPPPPPRKDTGVFIAEPPQRSARRFEPLRELASSSPLGIDEPLGLHLTFHDPVARIGDFQFKGPVKPLIDALAPLLGGDSHAPRDHRIRDLRVARGSDERGVDVALWVLS